MKSVVPTLLSAVFSSLAYADLQIYEPFAYGISETLDGQNGGTGFGTNAWEPETNATIGSGLTYPEVSSQGNGFLSGTGGAAARRNFDPLLPETGDETWFSFLLRRHSDRVARGGENDLMAFYLAPSERTPGISFGVIFDENAGGAAFFGSYGDPPESYFPGRGPEFFDPTKPFFTGTTYLMVGHIAWNLAGDEGITLFVNPAAEGGAPSSGEGLSLSGIDLRSDFGEMKDQLQRMTVLINEGGEWSVDEIRLGTSFADVTPVPEPALASFLLCGGLLISTRRRRFRP